MNAIGIERLCLFGMGPVEHVALAADLGCRHIGIGLKAMRIYNPHHYPDWSLLDDPQLRCDLIAALRDHGVEISLCEGLGVIPDRDIGEQQAALDVVAELGGKRINATSMDRDLSRTLDGFAALAEMAGARGIETTIELGPGPISTLPAGLEAVRHVGRKDFRLLIDTMHYFRFLKASVADAAALDPDVIGYVQLCDAPIEPRFPKYMEEALYERIAPGDGELPLLELLKHIPERVVISVEVPQRSLAEAGLGPRERVGACVQKARALLERVSAAN